VRCPNWIRKSLFFIWRELLSFSSEVGRTKGPNLSKDALKNLMDVLSGASLTIAAISLGLISNVGIALNDVPFRARQDLGQLLIIHSELPQASLEDQNQKFHRTVQVLPATNDKNLPADNVPREMQLLKTTVTDVAFVFPGIIPETEAGASISLKPAEGQVPVATVALRLVLEFSADQKWSSPFNHFLDKTHTFLPKLVGPATFDETFPNLALLGPNYRSLLLADLDRILDDESKRSKGELDVFGAKIPSDLLSFIGLPLLWILLVQFISTCRYIRANTAEISIEAASKWSGALKGFGSISFGFLTIWLLPLLASYLTVRYLPPEDKLLLCLFWILFILILLASGSGFRHLLEIRAMVFIEKQKENKDEGSKP
jgi:hypothetical protein